MRKDARKHPPLLPTPYPIHTHRITPARYHLTHECVPMKLCICKLYKTTFVANSLPAAIHSFISELYSYLFPGPARTFGTFFLFCFGWITRRWRDFYPYATHNDATDLNDVSFLPFVILEPKPKTKTPIVPYPHSFAPWFFVVCVFCFFVFVCLLFFFWVCSHMCFFIACL